ncbi:MAG: hypothetical protein KAQ75_08545, partial [Bacteroidales bacterium]|nr:hypothetical protein [Bacteroidales bacterium]
MRNILFLISIFSFISVNLFSQGELKQGNPFITNYYSKDYKGHAQNWAITQDSRGVMYFGNGDKGVMEFDGENFGFIPVANNSTVLSLDIDKNDKIYVGAVGEFGYIEADSIGQLVYKSYLDKINPADKNFTDVWATLCTTEGVYFFTKNVIFFINDNKVKTWYPKTSSFFLAYLVKSRLYVLETGY